jgi:branched-chain amino acid transport system ATP-binding protein
MADGAVAAQPLLRVRELGVRFGGIVALESVSFDVPRGQIVALIGPNGAGKTTLFNCLNRLYTPVAGDIELDGESLLGASAHDIAGLGIGRTFQNLALFDTMTVFDNVLIGCHQWSRSGFFGNMVRARRCRSEEADLRATAAEVIRFLDLGSVAATEVSGLPFGTRKRVELARALACRPRLLLMDEPAGGLNHEEVNELGALIQTVRDQRGITVLLVEHHMGLVMPISDKVVVLDFGRAIAEGTPDEVRNDPAVIQAYLGTDG